MKSEKDIRGGYRVPDGYFSEMKYTVIQKAVTKETPYHWLTAWKRLGSFAAGFAVMVLFAMMFVTLTPDNKMEQHQLAMQQSSIEEMIIMYDIDQNDLVDYYFEQDDNSIEESEELAIAIDSYIEFYGIDTIE